MRLWRLLRVLALVCPAFAPRVCPSVLPPSRADLLPPPLPWARSVLSFKNRDRNGSFSQAVEQEFTVRGWWGRIVSAVRLLKDRRECGDAAALG